MAQNTQQGDRDQGTRDQSTSNRGFGSMDDDKQRAIASEGGRAAHAQGTAHEFTSEEAREAGRKGGQSRGSDGSDSDRGGSSSGRSSGSDDGRGGRAGGRGE